MRGFLAVNISGKTQRAQSSPFLSSICQYTCHFSRVKMRQIPRPVNCLTLGVSGISVDPLFLQTHTGVPSVSLYLFLFENKYLSFANYMLEFLGAGNKAGPSPGPDRVSSSPEDRQTARLLCHVPRAVTGEFQCTKERARGFPVG